MNSSKKYVFLKEDYQEGIEKLNELENDYKKWGKVSTEEGGVGDWHDNPAYEEGMRQMNMLSDRISEIKAILSNAKIVNLDEIELGKETISLGCKVILESESGEYKKYFLGSYRTFRKNKYEGNYLIISYSSPIGKAVLGKKKGDEIDILIKNENKSFTIVDVL